MGSIWTSRGVGLGAKSQRRHHQAFTRTRQSNRFFFSLSFCVAHRVAELESLSVRFTFTAMLCAKVTLSSAPVEEDKVLKLKSFACRSLFHFIPPERRDTADEKRYFFFFWGGGFNDKKKSSTKCQKMVYL